MKKIAVLKLNEAFDRISACKGKYSVLYIVKNKKFLENLYYEKDRFGRLDIYAEHRKVRDLLKADKNCIEVMAEQFKGDDYFIEYWQADEIIRFCQRQFDIDNVFIIHEDHYNAATNLADQLALCYDIDFEYDYSVEQFDYLRRRILAKHSLITNSPLYTLSPLDYCKMICRYTYNQIGRIITGKSELDYNLFFDRQGVIYLKSGKKVYFDLEIVLPNVFIQDIDEIEYVEFLGVPEIVEPSAFKGSNPSIIEHYGIYDYYNGRNSLIPTKETVFVFDSINGIQRVKRSSYHTPEKYKNYEEFKRGYKEYYNKDTGFYDDPEMKNAFRGMVRSEKYLAEKNGYTPKFCRLPRRFPFDYLYFFDNNYIDHIQQFFDMMREHDIWDGDELEKLCVYAAYFYIGHICGYGHCENLTILKYFFESYFCDYDELPKFEKLWNIDKYTPSTDTDPVNQLCLAVYALIETMKPYNDEVIPKDTFRKCLDYAYELTEGKPELNNAVILAGTFAGIYCITLD